MGYTTTFDGEFTFNKPVTAKLQTEVNDFSRKRHNPNDGAPGYWCQWIIKQNSYNEDVLVWDQCEKFYNYSDWLEYLIKHFFEPEGYILNGSVEFEGEDSDDFGEIEVNNNVVNLKYGIHSMDLSDVDTQVLIKEVERRGYHVE